jgi:hypothetical protein
MAFESYTDLCEQVESWLGREDLSVEIKNCIYLAENDAQRSLRLRMVDQVKNGTFVEDLDYIQLPDDYLEGRYLKIDTNPSRRIDIVSAPTWHDVETRGGTINPSAGFVHGDRLYVAPPGGTEKWRLYYKAGIRHLSTKNKTNFLLRNYGDFLLYGALHHLGNFVGPNDRKEAWDREYARIAGEIKQQEWRARTGGGPLQTN